MNKSHKYFYLSSPESRAAAEFDKFYISELLFVQAECRFLQWGVSSLKRFIFSVI